MQSIIMQEILQLSLFPLENSYQEVNSKVKKSKLGRYEGLQRQLESDLNDSYKIFVEVNYPDLPLSDYKFVDLFSGAGGMSQGLTQAGFKSVASVEINPIASMTYQNNFPECRHFCGSIEDFHPEKWLEEMDKKNINIVVGGPPCQGFSVAGKRDPNDPRNRLFKQFIRVVSEIQPDYVVMENVPGILTIKNGQVKEEIRQEYENIGYPHMSVAILESAAYGIPQIRPRAIFIANRFNLPNPYPKPQLQPAKYKTIESAISDLPAYDRLPEINHEWTRHSDTYMQRIAEVPPGGSLYESYADAFKRQYPGKPSMTVKENHGGTHIHPYLNRVISAREMARLQSFPDSFIFAGSMKKAMWQIGNAVPPRLSECIGYALIPYLNKIFIDKLN